MSTPLQETTNSPTFRTSASTFKSETQAMQTEVAAPAPTFFTVVHTFACDEAKAQEWWTFIGGMSDDDRAAINAKWHGLGFHNHSFLPTSPTGVINCVWEAKADTSAEAFQTFMDGPDGPGEGIFKNDVYKVMPGAILPTAYFGATDEPAAPKATVGSFFWVFHTFKEGAAEGFWQSMESMAAADLEGLAAKNNKLGFHNHSFLPCAADGPCICIWESKAKMSAEEFVLFIDGPDGPGAGAVFDNTVHAAMDGATTPSAHFTEPPTVFICPPCGVAPDKVLGPAGGAQAMMWLIKLPDGRQAQRLKIQKGFDWRASISPLLPGCPQWCPATHFGHLESGSMGIRMMDGSEMTIKAGETYLVKPGHLPIMSEDAVMIEFSQDTTYTQDIKK